MEYISQYAIALESNSTKSTSEFHLHCVLIFNAEADITFNNLNGYIDYFYPRPKYRYNLQELKNLKASLDYISKEDTNLITNFGVCFLSGYYQLINYCRNNEILKMSDSIVYKTKLPYTVIQRIHSEVRAQLIPWKGFKLAKTQEFHTSCPWVLELLDAYNSNITSIDKKPKHIYLHGMTNCGKTTIVQQIIGQENLRGHTLILNNYESNFFMQNFIEGEHHYIICDEFKYGNCSESNINTLKKILERNSYVSIQKKFTSDSITKIFGPVIFISNYALPPHADNAFRSRLKIINATCPYFNCNNHPISSTVRIAKELEQQKANEDAEKEKTKYITKYGTKRYDTEPEPLTLDDHIFISQFFPRLKQNDSQALDTTKTLLLPHSK